MKQGVLDTQSAALALTAQVLRRAEQVFLRRRAMEERYHLGHGIFSRV